VISVIQTGGAQCATLFVAGPFSSVSAGCGTPKVSTASGNCTNACTDPDPWYDFDIDGVYQQGSEAGCYLGLAVGDPGNHSLLVGLIPGQFYLVAIQSDNSSVNFCIGVYEPASNARPTTSSATPIDACGTAFSGNTGGGHWPTGCGTTESYTSEDPDCDGTNEISSGVINNISWFYFCPTASGTWNVSLGVPTGGCILGNGVQGVILKDAAGPPYDLVLVQQSPSSCSAPGAGQIPPNCTWTSSNFTANAGDCIYIGVDGFGGDVCNYSITVTYVSGGQCPLPIELLSFGGEEKGGGVLLTWETATDKNISFYPVGWKTTSMSDFVDIGNVPSQQTMFGNTYYFFHENPQRGYNLYRLMTTSVDGVRDYAPNIVAVYVSDNTSPSVKIENGKLKIMGIDDDVVVNVFNSAGQLMASFPCKGTCSYELGNPTQKTIYYVRIYSDYKEIFKGPVVAE